jgi:hypothetical protein
MSTSVTEYQTQTCNGWSNQETWIANLWLSNDQGLYELLREAHKQLSDSYEVAEFISERLREQLFDEIGVACIWQDLLNSAFNRIDWIEVIENNLDTL